MVHEHGYSIRKLADKLGKDKGYLENRLRLADAPPEIRELVSLRKDSLSHAYELMKVDDPKKRRRLAAQVARGELTLIKLRDKIEGRRSRPEVAGEGAEAQGHVAVGRAAAGSVPADDWTTARPSPEVTDDSLMDAKQGLADAVETLVALLRSPELRGQIPVTDRANLAKYLTIAKLKLENAIAIVRTDNPDV
jgi:ParB-like chromosome segregation protein Spo0J